MITNNEELIIRAKQRIADSPVVRTATLERKVSKADATTKLANCEKIIENSISRSEGRVDLTLLHKIYLPYMAAYLEIINEQ